MTDLREISGYVLLFVFGVFVLIQNRKSAFNDGWNARGKYASSRFTVFTQPKSRERK